MRIYQAVAEFVCENNSYAGAGTLCKYTSHISTQYFSHCLQDGYLEKVGTNGGSFAEVSQTLERLTTGGEYWKRWEKIRILEKWELKGYQKGEKWDG